MRRTIRFLLGEETREIESSDPTATLLDWLRADARLTGTKEGCAEGDCGACTVAIGRLSGGRLRYEAINSCIRLLATIDGCHVVTIEHLKRSDGSLHPVQQAMAAHHGSQCGFCTPGIVMSLYALWLNEERPDETRIEDALAGNLCRCTGYQPIIAAARGISDFGRRREDPLIANADAIAARLKTLRDEETLLVEQEERRLIAPATVNALADAVVKEPRATMLAGGTDVGLWVTKEMRDIAPVIYLGRVEALKRVEDRGDALIFGAGANHIDVRKALATIHPQLDELMRRFGGEQIRNAGTIGGNIANGSPIGDLPPALIALGATIMLRRGAGRRVIPLEQFFIAYRKQDRRAGEFIETITVPKPPPDALIHVSKVSKRFDEDISSVCGAFLLRRGPDGLVAEARLAFGGMAATPKRAANAETILKGKPWSEESVALAIGCLAVDFKPLDDMRASARYRATVAGNLLRRFLMETTDAAIATRVAGLMRADAPRAAHG
ncbi:MAG: xanthine dehydrogenase small subunit [Rhizobiales bacterium 65-9]|nr:xanthine dehydrogenase small subunit [Hyphomicrobiales bacterium]OJY37883.1 MAG: xanthine dehydrogenase small subunit [Rhizobiales bacterium 65-9]